MGLSVEQINPRATWSRPTATMVKSAQNDGSARPAFALQPATLQQQIAIKPCGRVAGFGRTPQLMHRSARTYKPAHRGPFYAQTGPRRRRGGITSQFSRQRHNRNECNVGCLLSSSQQQQQKKKSLTTARAAARPPGPVAERAAAGTNQAGWLRCQGRANRAASLGG